MAFFYSGYGDARLFKMYAHPNGTEMYYSGFLQNPYYTFLVREDLTAGSLTYIRYFKRHCNLNSHTMSTSRFYCLNIGSPDFYVLEVTLSNGILQHAISPAIYSCSFSIWSMAISADETQAFISASKNGFDIGAVCKWGIGTLNDIRCLELGSLYVPLFIKRIVSNKVFLETNEVSVNGDLYFLYLDLETDVMIWNK